MTQDPARRARLVLGEANPATVTQIVCGIAERPRPPLAWYVVFAISATLTVALFAAVGYLIATGIGVWGNKDLPPALRLPHDARQKLVSEYGFEAMQGDGVAFLRREGPAAEVDLVELAELVFDLVCNVHLLPRSGAALAWQLSGP